MTIIINGDCGKLLRIPFDFGPTMIEVEKFNKKTDNKGLVIFSPPEFDFERSDEDISEIEETGCIKITQLSRSYLWVFDRYEDAWEYGCCGDG